MSRVPLFSRSMVTTWGTGTVVESVSVASSAVSPGSPWGPSAAAEAVLLTEPASMSAWVMA